MNEQNSSKKIVIIFILFIIAINFIELFSYSYDEEPIANPFDYARITDVEYKAVLVDEPNSNAKVIITERLTFDIHAASKENLFWELWRDLPEDYIDGLKVEYKVNSVKQIYDDRPDQIYTESSKLYWDDVDYINTTGGYGPGKWYHSEGPYNEYARQYECVFFYVDGLYREEVTFEIEYEMTNAALKYKDVSELYLTFYSEDTIKYLESFKGEVLIPLKDMPSTGNYEAYTYGTNSGSFPFTESSTKNPGYYTFSFDLDEDELKFRPYNQYIEFSLLAYGDDRHIFTNYAPNNTYSNDYVLEELRDEHEYYASLETNAKKNKTNTLLVSLVITFFVILSTIKKDKNIRKKHNFYTPTQEIQYFRDIPSNLDPYFAASLVFCKHKTPKDETNGYAAIMLSLVRKGYIELDKIDNLKNWTSDNIKIIVKYNPSKAIYPTRLSEAFQNIYSKGISQAEQQKQIVQLINQANNLNTQQTQTTQYIQPIKHSQNISQVQTNTNQLSQPQVAKPNQTTQPIQHYRPTQQIQTLNTNQLSQPQVAKPNQTTQPIQHYRPTQQIQTLNTNQLSQPVQVTRSSQITQTIHPERAMQNNQPMIISQSVKTIIEPQTNIPEPTLPKLEPLTPTEEEYFNLIVRHSLANEISMNNFQSKVSMDYDNTDSFVRNIENSIVNIGISQGYFQKANYKEPKEKTKSLAKSFIVIGIILTTIVNFISYQTRLDLAFGAFSILGITLIISGIYLNKISQKYILLTQYGEDEYAKWRGLYNFLNSETLMSERTVIELPLWEQYLVYATAFGISEKVIKALEIRCPEVDMSPMLKNPYYRSSNFRSSSRSFRSATRSASYTSRSGGYSSGGGYYGGGGRGGGGGGGGH